MKFNEAKCKVLHLRDRGNPQYQYRQDDDEIESSAAGKTWGYY